MSIRSLFSKRSPFPPRRRTRYGRFPSRRERSLRHEQLESRYLLSATPIISIDDSAVDVQEDNIVLIDEFVSRGVHLDRAYDMTLGPDGDFYVTSSATDSVLRYDGDTGELLEEFVTSGSVEIDAASGLAFGPDGNLYVSDNDAVFRYSGETGAFLGVFVEHGSGGLSSAQRLTFDDTGFLYVADYADTVLRYRSDRV